MTVTPTFTRDGRFTGRARAGTASCRVCLAGSDGAYFAGVCRFRSWGGRDNGLHGVRHATGAPAWHGESLEPADPWSIYGRRVGQARETDDGGAEGHHLGLGERPPLPRPLVRLRALQHACADSGRAGAGVRPDTFG